MFDPYENDPFVPIVVTKQGEAVRAKSLNRTDNEEIGEMLHILCDGIVKKSRVSPSHKVLYCGMCGLRRFFPGDVKTYAQLRAHFIKVLKLKSRARRKPTRKPRRKSS